MSSCCRNFFKKKKKDDEEEEEPWKCSQFSFREIETAICLRASHGFNRTKENPTHTHTIDQPQVWTVGSEETLFTLFLIDSICTLCSNLLNLLTLKKNSFLSLLKQHFAEVKPGL